MRFTTEMSRSALVAATLALLCACDSERERECDFVVGDVLDTTGEGGFIALDLVESPLRDLLAVFYSTGDGLHYAAVDTRIELGGQARVRSHRRMAPSCDTLSAQRQGQSVFVACGRKPRGEKDEAGTITLYQASEDSHSQVVLPWPVGRDHQGVSLALIDDHLELVFQDGRPGEWKIWHAELCVDWEALTPCSEEVRLLSAATLFAGAPQLSEIEGERFVTWTESLLTPSAANFAGTVMVSRSDSDGPIRSQPIRSAEVIFPRSLPVVAAGEEHPVLLFRDIRRPLRRPHLFAQEVRRGADAVRVGRSNDRRAARAFSCGDSLAIATPRSYGRNDILIGIHLLDEELRGRIAEQQVYEWAARFVDVAGACVQDKIWLAVAEENRLEGRPASLHLTALSCE